MVGEETDFEDFDVCPTSTGLLWLSKELWLGWDVQFQRLGFTKTDWLKAFQVFQSRCCTQSVVYQSRKTPVRE